MRSQGLHRKFNGKEFRWIDWAPTKTAAQAAKKRWLKAVSWANVRAVKVKHGYNIYIRP